jgi:hypothetical protein
MALTGNIEVFPLPEVLRLLARSGKNGCLRVEAAGIDGRIYLQQGTMSLATVASDVELLDQIAASSVVDPSRMEGRDTVTLPEAIADGHTSEDLTDLVREHVVESLYRIRKPGTGTFEFLVDAESRFRTGQSFDTEQVVSEADRRAADWADIEQTIADMSLPVRMARELRENEVTVNAPTWRVLAVLEGGTSISEIARHLGTTQFRAAREVASLIRTNLVEALPRPVELLAAPVSDTWFAPAPAAEAPVFVGEPEVPEVAAEEIQSPWASAPADPSAAEDTAWHDDPWSQPPSDETSDLTVDEPAREQPSVETRSTPTESATEPSRGGWWAEAMGAADELGEIDTDEFLESVFSEAESAGEVAEEESGFSMGLLRRRRMGPVARDLSEG